MNSYMAKKDPELYDYNKNYILLSKCLFNEMKRYMSDVEYTGAYLNPHVRTS
jgi:hypothetical protein